VTTNTDKAGQAGATQEVLLPERGETDILREITDAMTLAGIVALGEWEQKREDGRDVTKGDLVRSIYAAMRCSL